jgi:hypothetical protein
MVAAHERGDFARQRGGRQWPGGDDERAVEAHRNLLNLFPHDRDQRMRGDRTRHLFGELIAIDCERRTGGNAREVRGLHHHRPEPPHLLFQ